MNEKTKDQLIEEIGKLQEKIDGLEKPAQRQTTPGSEDERYKGFADLLPQTIFEIDLDGKLTYVNKYAFELTGYTIEDFEKGINVSDLIIPEDRKRLKDNIASLFKGGAESGNEYTAVKKDGSTFPLTIFSNLIIKDNQPIGLRGVAIDNTLREKREKDLAQSEERYRSLVELSPLPIAVHSGGKVVYINKAGCESLGAKNEDEILGMPVMDIVHPDYKEIVMERIRKGIEEGIFSSPLPEKFIKLDGKIIDVETTAIPIIFDGKPAMQVIIIDVTSREQARVDLRHTQTLLKSVIEQSPVPMVVAEPDGTITLFNQACLEFLGVGDDSEFKEGSVIAELKQTWEEYDADGNLIPKEKCPLGKALRGIETKNEEHKIIRKDGTERWEMAHGVPIYSENNELIAGLRIFPDITDLKNTERALRESEENLRQILGQMPNPVIVADSEGNAVVINYAFLTMFGLESDVEIIESYNIFNDPVYEEINILQGIRAALKGQIITLPEVYMGAGNKFSWAATPLKQNMIFEIMIFPVFSSSSGIKQIVMIFKDITKKLRIENELRKIDKLESIGLLAGGIAHDFNNILTALLSNISLAKMQSDTESETYTFLTNAEKAAKYATDLANQLLTFASGGAPIKETADIRELVEENVKFALSGSNVKSKFIIEDDIWLVEIDKNQISQVINNLIRNSSDAMPDGGIITITLRNQKPATAPEELSRMINYINLNIKDMGKGIPEEIRERIFDPFFTTKKKGKGLGLATAYSIITKHNGHIHFTSIEGKGTAFDIYLPASRSKSIIEEGRGVEIPGSGKILLMDDEETILEAMTETLGHLGYSVTPCMNGVEAFQKYKNAKESNEPFDAVILDLTIPGGMGGKITMRKILQLDPSAKGIVSSGYSGNQIISKYKDYGFSGAITKPFTISALSEILKKILKN